jgi:hypothetical protein
MYLIDLRLQMSKTQEESHFQRDSTCASQGCHQLPQCSMVSIYHQNPRISAFGYLQKQLFIGSFYFHVRYLSIAIMYSDPITRFLTQNIYRLLRKVLQKKVTYRFGCGYSH